MLFKEVQRGKRRGARLNCWHYYVNHASPEWVEQLLKENRIDEWLKLKHQQIIDQIAPRGFLILEGFVMFNHRYCLGAMSPLREAILLECHDSKLGGAHGILSNIIIPGTPAISLEGNDPIY